MLGSVSVTVQGELVQAEAEPVPEIDSRWAPGVVGLAITSMLVPLGSRPVGQASSAPPLTLHVVEPGPVSLTARMKPVGP